MSEDWAPSDAVRVLGIALFRQQYDEPIGALPSNGTMGDFAFADAERLMERCPGLRYVLEAGCRALATGNGDPIYDPWLVTLYAGGEGDCLRTEQVIAATFSEGVPA